MYICWLVLLGAYIVTLIQLHSMDVPISLSPKFLNYDSINLNFKFWHLKVQLKTQNFYKSFHGQYNEWLLKKIYWVMYITWFVFVLTGIQPSKYQTYSIKSINKALKEVLGMASGIFCLSAHKEHLIWIALCVDKTATNFIPCPSETSVNCSSQVYFDPLTAMYHDQYLQSPGLLHYDTPSSLQQLNWNILVDNSAWAFQEFPNAIME